MSPKDVIRTDLLSSEHIVGLYLDDLSDSDIMVRAVPGMNHIAWQLGHIISGENHFANLVRPGTMPPLPDGFAEAHSKEAAATDDPSKFRSLAEYRSIWKAQREGTMAALEAIPEADLDKTDPGKFPEYAPTVARLLQLIAMHPMMHSGQWVAVRRRLNKPVVI
jgi:hypothetical protein